MPFAKPLIVAVDDGYDCLKVVTYDRQEIFPTSVSFAPRRGVQLMPGGRTLDERHYEIERTVYAVGADVRDAIDTRFDDFKFSGENLALAINALREVVPPGRAVHAITGMPLDRYFRSSGEGRESLNIRKRRAWTREVRDPRGGILPQIINVTVMSEAVAAWYDYVISAELKPDLDRINDDTIVVDIGGRTTDVAIFEHGRFDAHRSGTLEHGLLDLAEVITRAVRDQHPGTPRLPHKIIRSALQHGTIQIDGREIEMSEEIGQARQQLVRHLVAHVMSVQRRTSLMNRRLLFVGGGSIALEAELREHFPDLIAAPDSQFANARGMWKHAQLSERAGSDTQRVAGTSNAADAPRMGSVFGR